MDTVLIEFPPGSEYPGVTLSTVDPVNLVRATVTRRVDTTLMRLLGSNFTMVSAKGTAATVDVVAPVPIIVTHPTFSGSFAINGNPNHHDLRRTRPQHSGEFVQHDFDSH